MVFCDPPPETRYLSGFLANVADTIEILSLFLESLTISLRHRFVSNILRSSQNNWGNILSALTIPIPGTNQHGPCPVCGGKDRFRFDDKRGRGTWFCNYCGHGDGLDLVSRVRQCGIIQAAILTYQRNLPAGWISWKLRG